MTYRKDVPPFVFERWMVTNPTYKIDFSLDCDCICFLREKFNDYIADLFMKIPQGMYKADLWRLCKLYINGGIYADVDLIPHLDIDKLDKEITFYSCLSIQKKSLFQAFIATFTKPKNPLILSFLMSFLLNNPYTYTNGPTYDIYNCIYHNLKTNEILHDTKYEIDEVKINIHVGTSKENTKKIDLHYFPLDIEYNMKLVENNTTDNFFLFIINGILIITRKDKQTGWTHDHSVDICIKSKQSILLFKENIGENNNAAKSYVTFNGKKILDSRDMNYYNNNKSW